MICEFRRKTQAHEPGSLSPTLTAQIWLVHKGCLFAIVLIHTGHFMKQFWLKTGYPCIAYAWWVHACRDKPVLQSGLFYNEGNLFILHLSEAERCHGWVHRWWPQTGELQIPPATCSTRVVRIQWDNIHKAFRTAPGTRWMLCKCLVLILPFCSVVQLAHSTHLEKGETGWLPIHTSITEF